MTARLRAVVCGTTFGQVYMEAFRVAELACDLVGVVARGSDRSRACARHYGVPLITDVEQVDADVACVAVRGGLLGGQGTELAKQLMARGIHVVQEHPVHHNELAECLREARRLGVAYQLNAFYTDLPPVRRFLAAVRELLVGQPPRYIDAMCGFQVAYAMLDIIGTALGRLRPYAFEGVPAGPSSRPFRSLDGIIGGVPVSLRVQNQMDPSDPDNYPHLLHRITVGVEGGDLTLVTTMGPIVWSARPRIPRHARDPGGQPLFGGQALDTDDASALVIGPAAAPGHATVFGSLWPQAAANAWRRVHETVHSGEDPLRRGQYHLTLCQMWQDIAAKLGPPELLDQEELQPLSAEDLSRVLLAAGP